MTDIRALTFLSSPRNFCSKCGKKMIHKQFLICFNDRTGDPIYGTRSRCPEYSWFNPMHDKYEDPFHPTPGEVLI